MAKYRVKPGYVHGAFDQYRSGDVVEYAPEDAAGFLDKLELIANDGVVTLLIKEDGTSELFDLSSKSDGIRSDGISAKLMNVDSEAAETSKPAMPPSRRRSKGSTAAKSED